MSGLGFDRQDDPAPLTPHTSSFNSYCFKPPFLVSLEPHGAFESQHKSSQLDPILMPSPLGFPLIIYCTFLSLCILSFFQVIIFFHFPSAVTLPALLQLMFFLPRCFYLTLPFALCKISLFMQLARQDFSHSFSGLPRSSFLGSSLFSHPNQFFFLVSWSPSWFFSSSILR